MREGGEAEAVLKLPPETLGTHVEELLGHQAAEFDYRLKRGSHRFGSLLDMHRRRARRRRQQRWSRFAVSACAKTWAADPAHPQAGGNRAPGKG